MKKLFILLLLVLGLVEVSAQTETFRYGNQTITVDIARTINDYYADAINGRWNCMPAVVECGAKKYGNPKAEYLYGMALMQGIDVQRNTSEGMSWLRKSANQGDAEAAGELGSYLEEAGQYNEAERYLLQAIRKPALYAYLELGTLYMRLNKLDLAERYLLMAVNNGPKGQTDAIHNVVILYSKQNRLSDMVIVLRKGAYTYNNPWSQGQLGYILYQFGSTFNGNPTFNEKREGLSLLNKAAAAGDQSAIQSLREINK